MFNLYFYSLQEKGWRRDIRINHFCSSTKLYIKVNLFKYLKVKSSKHFRLLVIYSVLFIVLTLQLLHSRDLEGYSISYILGDPQVYISSPILFTNDPAINSAQPRTSFSICKAHKNLIQHLKLFSCLFFSTTSQTCYYYILPHLIK